MRSPSGISGLETGSAATRFFLCLVRCGFVADWVPRGVSYGRGGPLYAYAQALCTLLSCVRGVSILANGLTAQTHIGGTFSKCGPHVRFQSDLEVYIS